MKKIIKFILIISILTICIIIIMYNYSKKNSENMVSLNETDKSNNIQFKYDEKRPIDEQYLKEQTHGANLKSWYPNTWIEKIENGVPIYNSRKNVIKTTEDFVESKARFSYEFNSPRSTQMDGILDPTDFKNIEGRTLKEIYDKSFVDYKNMEPKKPLIYSNQLDVQKASSNLLFTTPDTWKYEHEKPENGGYFESGIMASDPYATQLIGNTYAVVDIVN